MKLAICSDLHDNLWVLEKALPGMAQAEAMVFCGDLCAPFSLKALSEGFHGPLHVVWGNNDGDKWLMTETAHEVGNVTIHGEIAELDFNGYRVAAVHYPRIGRALARSGMYDLTCYGHDHLQHYERVGAGLLLNPGELMGRFGRVTYAMVDTVARQVQVVEVSTR